jgi:hypothetical protein
VKTAYGTNSAIEILQITPSSGGTLSLTVTNYPANSRTISVTAAGERQTKCFKADNGVEVSFNEE